MANAEQIKALIKSHYTSDSDQFTTTALQLAAAEARSGHRQLAGEIKDLVTEGKKKFSPLRALTNDPVLNDLLQESKADHRLTHLIGSDELKASLDRIISEFLQRNKLQKFGLTHRRKLLLTGPPGTGKTMSASVIASELNLPLYIIHTDKLITKYMGETAVKLRQVFEFTNQHLGVYFFDEFDAIGTERSRDNEVGEMRRILNSFLQFLEEENSSSFVLAATNHIGLLDKALFRRFDDVLMYELPEPHEAIQLITNRLAIFKPDFALDKIPESSFKGLSHAEITQACDDAIKNAVLRDANRVEKSVLLQMLVARQRAAGIK